MVDALRREQRFVFLFSGGPEVFDGADVEIRAEILADAEQQATKLVGLYGCDSVKVIGRREGFRSTARFIPIVPLDEVPAHILQNERFAGRVPCDVCEDGDCLVCDDAGTRDAEIARLEAHHGSFWVSTRKSA